MRNGKTRLKKEIARNIKLSFQKEERSKSVEGGWNDKELGIRDRKVKASDVIQKKAGIECEKKKL